MKRENLTIPKEFQHIQPEKKARILSSALECFAHYGYHGASIKRIADYAGVSKALIYNYYKSKDELLADLLRMGMMALAGIYKITNEPQSIEEASVFIDRTFDVMDESPHFWKIYFTILMNADAMHLVKPILLEEVMPHFFAMAKTWEKFDVYISNEEFMFLGAVLDGVGMHYLINGEFFPRAFAIKRLKELFGFIKKQ